jgi:hypothetical protein
MGFLRMKEMIEIREVILVMICAGAEDPIFRNTPVPGKDHTHTIVNCR